MSEPLGERAKRVPRRSGGDVACLRAAAALSGLGEGVAAVALPLLAAGVTRDPLSIAAVVAAQHLPWAIVALFGTRVLAHGDGRTVVGGVDSLRAAAMGLLGLAALTDGETVTMVLAVALAVGLGDALTDDVEVSTAARRGGSPGRPFAVGALVGLAVFGLPLGGLLYELLPAVPFLAGVLPFAVAGLLMLIVREPIVRDVAPGRRTRLVPGTLPLAVLAALATALNSAVLGVLVLFALDDLGIGAPSFGLLLAGLAAAAAGASLAAPEVGRILGPRRGLAVALAAAGVAYVGAVLVADPGYPLVAAFLLAVAGGAVMVVGVLVRALLHTVAGRGLDDAALRAFHGMVWAAIPVGALVGGLVARASGVGPLVAGVGVVSVVVAVAAGRAVPTAPAPAGRHRPRVGLRSPHRSFGATGRPRARAGPPSPTRPRGFSRNSVDARR